MPRKRNLRSIFSGTVDSPPLEEGRMLQVVDLRRYILTRKAVNSARKKGGWKLVS